MYNPYITRPLNLDYGSYEGYIRHFHLAAWEPFAHPGWGPGRLGERPAMRALGLEFRV